jgi:hypothetical protein
MSVKGHERLGGASCRSSHVRNAPLATLGPIKAACREGPIRDIGDGYADTSSHGRVCFVISLNSNDGAMRFRLLKATEAGL